MFHFPYRNISNPRLNLQINAWYMKNRKIFLIYRLSLLSVWSTRFFVADILVIFCWVNFLYIINEWNCFLACQTLLHRRRLYFNCNTWYMFDRYKAEVENWPPKVKVSYEQRLLLLLNLWCYRQCHLSHIPEK